MSDNKSWSAAAVILAAVLATIAALIAAIWYYRRPSALPPVVQTVEDKIKAGAASPEEQAAYEDYMSDSGLELGSSMAVALVAGAGVGLTAGVLSKSTPLAVGLGLVTAVTVGWLMYRKVNQDDAKGVEAANALATGGSATETSEPVIGLGIGVKTAESAGESAGKITDSPEETYHRPGHEIRSVNRWLTHQGG